jgi:flagellin-like protein
LGRSFRMDDRGISPIIATIILVAVTVTAAGVVAAYVAGLYVPGGTSVLSVTVDGAVFDTNSAQADNYENGDIRIDIKVMSDDIDDVLDTTEPLTITISGQGRAWTSFTMTLENSGTVSESNYGSVIKVPTTGYNWETDVLDTGDNIGWRLEVPTTTGGEVDEGMAIHIYLTAQTSGNNILWDDRDTINLDVVGRGDALSLTGFDGAYLFGIADDTGA